jgi:hypothetical protein
MCITCLDNPNEFREYIKDLIYAEYAKPDLVRTSDSVEGFAASVRYLVDNREEHDYTDAEIENFLDILSRMTAAENEEALAPLIEEFKAALRVDEETMANLMDFDIDPLRGPSEDTIMDDLKAFPDEQLWEHFIRAIQHTYYYHETRPEYMNLMLGQKFIDAIGNRMAKYADGAMAEMDDFRSSFLVLDEQNARYAMATIMTGVYIEALFAGYYAGAKGQDCPMWFTHDLGPIGRQDTRPPEEKIPEVIQRILTNMIPPDMPTPDDEENS